MLVPKNLGAVLFFQFILLWRIFAKKYDDELVPNSYAGFQIPYHGWNCERIPMPSSSKEFYDNYISKRKPVIIETGITGLTKFGWRPLDTWTDEYLNEKSGQSLVQVMVRNSSRHMGTKNHIHIKLKDFLTDKSSLYYITQFQGRRVGATAPFLKKFLEDFTIPFWYSVPISSVNLWLGYSDHSDSMSHNADSSEQYFSSRTFTNGHFDGIDNLFVVMDGVKTFRIWDPSSAEGLYTWRTISKINENGDMPQLKERNKQIPYDKRYLSNYRSKKPRTIHAPTFADRYDVNVSDREISDRELLKKAYPKYFTNTVAGVCSMGPGDILYLPGCFFHEVESVGEKSKKGRHLGINFWFKYTGDESIDQIEFEKAKSLL